MPQTPDSVFYQLYFQAPGVAEAALSQDVRRSIRGVLFANSGDDPRNADIDPETVGIVRRGGGMQARLVNHLSEVGTLPAWISEADVDFYTEEFSRTGFRGGLNWYRNIDRNWELLAAFDRVLVTVPALFIGGDRDLVMAFRGARELVVKLSTFVPQLRRALMLEGCGHWTQQERPQEVNAAMIDFLVSL